MEQLLKSFRKRLSEYRFERMNSKVSIHVNALEMALSLSEYAFYEKRNITTDELKWFDAGLQLEYVFGGSEWEDLLDYYSELYQKVVIEGALRE